MERMPKAGEFYRHFKNKLYQVIAVATHSETGEAMVVYQALYGDYGVYVRPLSMFVSEVDREKYPDVKQRFRFEKVTFDQPERQEESTEEDAALHPLFFQFLDAEGAEERLAVLWKMLGTKSHGEEASVLVGQRELDGMYLALDMKTETGDIRGQLQSIRKHLETQMRYDGSRLRGK